MSDTKDAHINFLELKSKSGLNDRQISLLANLVALEGAGMVWNGTTLLVNPSYDDGCMEVESPGFVTHKGMELVQALSKSGHKIFL